MTGKESVEVCVASNLLTHYGSFSEADAEAYFDAAHEEQITGIAAAGGAATLAGTDDAARLLQFPP